MADITMCTNFKCKLAYKCYRATAIPSRYQSMSHFEPNDRGVCESFWHNGVKDIQLPIVKELRINYFRQLFEFDGDLT